MTKKIEVTYKNIEDLIPYVRNARTHSDEQIAQLSGSIREFGWTNPILVDEKNNVIAGHGRIMAARKLGIAEIPSIVLTGLTKAQQQALVLADNKLALNSGWDEEMLKAELESLQEVDFDLGTIGFSEIELDEIFNGEEPDDEGGDYGRPKTNGALSDKFLFPPFSILNSRAGDWVERKRFWLNTYGIKSELGRSENLTFSDNLIKFDQYVSLSTTSIFDPVLCELVYRWFTHEGATVLDPFAGGSVRGVIASKLNRQYIGCELRKEQVEENKKQVSEICSDDDFPPAYICGDSRFINETCKDVSADLVFSCPPYADLEVYSDDPKDLSTLEYSEFKEAYFDIIKKACSLLKEDRFAVFVVGEVRSKDGGYYNFVADTIEAFRSSGLKYYNEAILANAVATAAIRCSKPFIGSRKLCKTHQNVLVFVKGDPKKAAEWCGEIEVDIPERYLLPEGEDAE